MSLKVQYVNEMPFVKVPVGRIYELPECVCKIVNGKWGKCVGVFLKESPPSVRESLEKIEEKLRDIADENRSELYYQLRENYYDFERTELKLIKNDVFWGKFQSIATSPKMKARVRIMVTHLFFSPLRVSISCSVSRIQKVPSL